MKIEDLVTVSDSGSWHIRPNVHNQVGIVLADEGDRMLVMWVEDGKVHTTYENPEDLEVR